MSLIQNGNRNAWFFLTTFLKKRLSAWKWQNPRKTRHWWHFPYLANMGKEHFSSLKHSLATDNMTELLNVFQHQPITSVVMAINIAIVGSLFTLDSNAGFLPAHWASACNSTHVQTWKVFFREPFVYWAVYFVTWTVWGECKGTIGGLDTSALGHCSSHRHTFQDVHLSFILQVSTKWNTALWNKCCMWSSPKLLGLTIPSGFSYHLKGCKGFCNFTWSKSFQSSLLNIFWPELGLYLTAMA